MQDSSTSGKKPIKEVQELRARKPKLERAGSDITDHKRAEKLLQKERDKAQEYLDIAAVMLVAVDVEERVGLINKKGCEILGYKEEEEVIGKNWFDNFLPPRIKHQVRGVFEKLIRRAADAPEYYENLILTKDGDERLIAWHNTVLRNDEGQVVAILSSGEDITERKRAEEELKRYNEFIANVINALDDPVFVKDEQHRWVILNDAACKVMGRSREELVGRSDYDLFPQEQADVFWQRDNSVLKNGQTDLNEEEITWHRKLHTISTKKSLFTDSVTGKKFIVGTIRDITERKKAEEALREREEKYRTLSKNIPGFIYRGKPDWSTEVVSGSEGVCGYSVEEFSSEKIHWLDIVHPDDKEKVLNESFQLANERSEIVQEYRIIDKSGKIRWIEDHKISVFTKEGLFKGVDGVAFDITDRKRAQEKIARVAKFPAENPNPVLRISSDGTIVYANEASTIVLETWGCSVGQRIPEPCREQLDRCFNSGKVSSFEFSCHSGQIFSVTLAPMVESGYVNAYGLDVTERKIAEQKLLEDQAKLKSLASELSLAEERERRRIAMELHDRIGQSLVISKMNLDEIRQSVPDEKLNAVLDKVCDSLDQTIDDTRTLTFDLSSPILYELGFEAAVAEWLTEQIQEKHGIATQFEDDGQPKPLDDDISILLFRDVRELLINVVKHARAKNIKVSVHKVGSRICVSVQDDGVGFDPAEAASTAAKRAEFGLFSIRQRLEELGGHLEIKSEPGCGCKATITAPLKQE